jgi:hypothetical protein
MSNRTLEEWEAEAMEDPAFRAACEKLEPEHQLARLRIQLELANKRAAAWKRAAKWERSYRRAFQGWAIFQQVGLSLRESLNKLPRMEKRK